MDFRKYKKLETLPYEKKTYRILIEIIITFT